MNTEQERAEFEAWAKDGFHLQRGFNGDYRATITQIAWACWQAAYQAGRAALQSQDREDAERLNFLESEWFWRDFRGNWNFNFNECWDAGRHDDLRAAIDHARRVEGEAK